MPEHRRAWIFRKGIGILQNEPFERANREAWTAVPTTGNQVLTPGTDVPGSPRELYEKEMSHVIRQRPVIALLAAGFLLLVPESRAQKDDASKKDLETMQGAWFIRVSSHQQTVADKDNPFWKLRWIDIKDGSFSIQTDDKERKTLVKGTLKLDGSGPRKQLEMKFTEGPNKGKTQVGYYIIGKSRDDKVMVEFFLSSAGAKRAAEERKSDIVATFMRDKP